jgi:hypothetical protein
MKAQSVEDIYNIFIHEQYLKKDDKDYYVPLYGKQLQKFVTALTKNQIPSKTFFIAGQSGNGKSSVLNLLTTNYPQIDEKYDFFYIAGRSVFLYDDIDIIDILLMIANKIIEKDPNLKKEYFEKLQKLEDVKNGTLLESETTTDESKLGTSTNAKISIGSKFFSILKLSGDFEASYKINEDIRKDARKLFKIQKKELIDLVNTLISDYKSSSNRAELLIVIDDLEKKNDIDNLFLKDMQLLNQLNIVKIITMPIHLQRNNTFADKDIREFGLKLRTFDGGEFTQDIELLKEIIDIRLEDKTIISDEAVNLAVEYSGGNLRQLIKLIHFAAEEALTFEEIMIGKKEMEASIEELERELSSKVMGMTSFLNQIKTEKTAEDSEDTMNLLAKATKMELVFAYFNGTIWYGVNPAIEKSLALYTKK